MEITVPQNEKYIKLLRIFSHEFVGEGVSTSLDSTILLH